MNKIWLSALCSLILVLTIGHAAQAQQKVKLERADKLTSGRDSQGQYNRLTGNVKFRQNQTQIWCDSAFLYKTTNRIEAFGHVKIKDGDSITITSNKLTYLGNERLARLREDVVFDNKEIKLYTDFLDYDRTASLAYYFNEGMLVDSTNQVTSVKGYYQTYSRVMSFKTDVVLTNTQDSLLSDSLVYYTTSKIVNFVAPTVVFDPDGNKATYEDGVYNTISDKSDLQIAKLENDRYLLTGDKMNLDNLRSYYRVTGNVYMFDKQDEIIITGAMAEHWKLDGITKVYGPNALLRKVMGEGDTLYLSADTLISLDGPNVDEKRLLAYHQVQVYKPDMQAVADSLSYVVADSVLHFYKDPVLWTGKTQLIADSINMEIRASQIHKINLISKSFMVMQDTTAIYNQIKGRKMNLLFANNKLDKVYVDGNGESIYFARDEETESVVGMNKIICSSMLIRFKEEKTDKVTFYTDPDAQFLPPKNLTESITKLKGFDWLNDYRPSIDTVLGLKERQLWQPGGAATTAVSTDKAIEQNVDDGG